MVQKTTSPLSTIFFTTRTTLKELPNYVIRVAKELYATAAANDLLPAASLHWIYTGADGKPETEFTLEIALPVLGQLKENTVFKQKELPAFKCISVIHHGAWDSLYETYDKLVDEAGAKQAALTGVCREVYHLIDMVNPQNNITEVQMGVR